MRKKKTSMKWNHIHELEIYKTKIEFEQNWEFSFQFEDIENLALLMEWSKINIKNESYKLLCGDSNKKAIKKQ